VARPPEVTPRPAPAVQRVELEQQRQQWRRQRLISSQISTTLRGLIDLCAGRQLALRPGLRGTLWVMLSLDSPASSDAAALTGLEVTSEEVTVPTFESCLRQRLGDTALPKPISALRLHIPYHLGAPDSADEEDDDDDDSSSPESEGGQSSS
jgi:hypothetical protein